MLSVIMLNVANYPFMLSVIMLNVIMLTVIMLYVVMLNFVMLSVVVLHWAIPYSKDSLDKHSSLFY